MTVFPVAPFRMLSRRVRNTIGHITVSWKPALMLLPYMQFCAKLVNVHEAIVTLSK